MPTTITWSQYLTAVARAESGRAEGVGEIDRTADFLKLLDGHRALLYQIIRTYCPEREDWRDLEQEIVLQLWRSFPSYDPTHRASTWVWRIAFNVTATDFRKRSRRRQWVAERPSTSLFQRQGEEGDGVAAERRERLYAAIRLLPQADRSVLLLHLDGHDYARIAEVTGFTASNVGTRLHRIRKKLQRQIATNGLPQD